MPPSSCGNTRVTNTDSSKANDNHNSNKTSSSSNNTPGGCLDRQEKFCFATNSKLAKYIASNKPKKKLALNAYFTMYAVS